MAVSRGRGQLADRFYDRVMFPIFDEQGHNIAFGGRIMGDGQPKYLNTAETSVFHKKRNLYGFNWAKEFIVAQDTAIVVEGYTDCIACWEAGIKNVVATLGTALTEHHVKTLTRFAKRIVYMFDGDAAGQKAARRAIQFIEQDSMDLRCVVLPDGNDPMEFITAHGGEALQARIDAAEPLMDFVYRSLQESSDITTPGGRAKALEDALTLIYPLRDSYMIDTYLSRLRTFWVWIWRRCVRARAVCFAMLPSVRTPSVVASRTTSASGRRPSVQAARAVGRLVRKGRLAVLGRRG